MLVFQDHHSQLKTKLKELKDVSVILLLVILVSLILILILLLANPPVSDFGAFQGSKITKKVRFADSDGADSDSIPDDQSARGDSGEESEGVQAVVIGRDHHGLAILH